MSRLSLFLPPFSGDYSGACAVLFPFDCMAVILDAGCCTRNYAEYDEPRWTSKRKATFSAQIRTLDTVMGDEAGIVGQVVDTARKLDPSCIALVGTPVPAIVGMDLAGMALDVRDACGIPCLGISTNGFDTYERGVSKALEALVGAFVPAGDAARRDAAAGDGRSSTEGEAPLRVNLLGATPLDFAHGEDELARWRELLQAEGVEVAFDGWAPFRVDDVSALGRADASLVVSWGGLAAARALQRRAQVPYVVGVPIDGASAARLAERLRAAVRGAASGEARSDGAPAQEPPAGAPAAGGDGPSCDPRVLLVGDQVAMGSLREALAADGALDAGEIAVATFFSQDRGLARCGDLFFAEDADLERYLQCHPDTLVVGDPLLALLPSLGEQLLVKAVHPAVSGQLGGDGVTSGKGLLDEIRLRAGA